MTVKWPKNGRKWPKHGKKIAPKAKRLQNGVKTTPAWCQNDAKMIPKWPYIDQKWSKITQNHPEMVTFWSQNGPIRALYTADMVKNGSKWVKNGSKWGGGGQKGPKKVQKASRPSSNCLKNSKSTQGPSRYTHLLHTFMGWNVDSDLFVTAKRVFLAEKGLFLHNFA